MSGPYEKAHLLDDVCRAVLREKETATGCLLVIFYGDLAEVVTAEKDMTQDLSGVAEKLRKAATKVDEIHAADQQVKKF